METFYFSDLEWCGPALEDRSAYSEVDSRQRKLAQRVWGASGQNARLARTIVLKLKTKEYTLTRSLTPLVMPTFLEEFASVALSLFERVELGPSQLFRLVGASMHLMRARQQLLAFLLRHGRSYPTGKHWTQRHRSWLAGQTFQQEVHRIVFQDYVETVWTAQERRDALIERIGAMTASWSLGPLVEALRGLRGIDLLSAATFICTTGDLSRFESPRMLMGYLGLVPSEHSSGGSVRRGGITKAGNREARRMLIEAAWSYRYPARVAKEKAEILVRLPKNIRDIAWKAQTRLCARYRTMIARGKKPTVVVTALARELAGFIWAIGQKMRTPMTT